MCDLDGRTSTRGRGAARSLQGASCRVGWRIADKIRRACSGWLHAPAEGDRWPAVWDGVGWTSRSTSCLIGQRRTTLMMRGTAMAKFRLLDGTGEIELKGTVEDVDRHGNVRIYVRPPGGK